MLDNARSRGLCHRERGAGLLAVERDDLPLGRPHRREGPDGERPEVGRQRRGLAEEHAVPAVLGGGDVGDRSVADRAHPIGHAEGELEGHLVTRLVEQGKARRASTNRLREHGPATVTCGGRPRRVLPGLAPVRTERVIPDSGCASGSEAPVATGIRLRRLLAMGPRELESTRASHLARASGRADSARPSKARQRDRSTGDG